MSNKVLTAADIDGPVEALTSVGDSVSVRHIGCSDQKKVTLTRTKLGYVGYCHKCGGTYFSPALGGTELMASSPPPASKVAARRASRRAGAGIANAAAVAWLAKYGIGPADLSTFGIFGTATVDSRLDLDVINPIGEKEIHSRYLGVPCAGPKWLTYRDGPAYPIVVSQVFQHEMLILTEDLISACCVERELRSLILGTRSGTRFTVASLNGLSLTWEAAAWIWTTFERVILVPDVDAAGKSESGNLCRLVLAPLLGTGSVTVRPFGEPSPKDVGTSGGQWHNFASDVIVLSTDLITNRACASKN